MHTEKPVEQLALQRGVQTLRDIVARGVELFVDRYLHIVAQGDVQHRIAQRQIDAAAQPVGVGGR
ncbi:MAG: hypothetical protein U5K56_04765 [Halioglobus sp.]|nr:hypothetical protein [Halioglobus sp.]